VQPRFGGVDLDALAADIRRALAGDLSVAGKLRRRDRAASAGAAPRLVWQPATDAAVLEVRATDSPALLYRIAHALEEAGANVRAARISTLGAEVVDAFYLEGTEWDDRTRRAEIEAAVHAALSGPVPEGAERPR
jgi:[protein-PII] uridylyltransferase